MPIALRRLLLLTIAGAVVGWIVLGRARTASAPGPAPTWPPFDPPTGRSTTTGAEDAVTGHDGGSPPAWVAPTDGMCPIDHPLKANDNSGIYHAPDGRFYDRTHAERCYARAEDAEADGYRAAKA